MNESLEPIVIRSESRAMAIAAVALVAALESGLMLTLAGRSPAENSKATDAATQTRVETVHPHAGGMAHHHGAARLGCTPTSRPTLCQSVRILGEARRGYRLARQARRIAGPD